MLGSNPFIGFVFVVAMTMCAWFIVGMVFVIAELMQWVGLI